MLVSDIHVFLDYKVSSQSEFFLNMLVSERNQLVLQEQLNIDHTPESGQAQPLRYRLSKDAMRNRLAAFSAAPGLVRINYKARTVINNESRPSQAPLQEISDLPAKVIAAIKPSRYCESDLMSQQAQELFSRQGDGIAMVESIIDWIQDNIEYQTGSSDSTTSAWDVFESRKGVCRDFAHLAITFCRALNIPARFCVGYIYFDEPPQDFHALFEAYLDGRWIKFDPTRMAPPDNLVVIANGMDAKDTPFASIFGAIETTRMRINIEQFDPLSDYRRKAGDEQKAIIGE